MAVAKLSFGLEYMSVLNGSSQTHPFGMMNEQ